RLEETVILLFDGRADNVGNRTQTKGTWHSAAPRHRGGTNLLFLDGHVTCHRARLNDCGLWPDAGPFVWDWRESR
ncbi:MAG: H-X9-DG-CTERM domain-containing protein, partial [Planctomycetota bacterium]